MLRGIARLISEKEKTTARTESAKKKKQPSRDNLGINYVPGNQTYYTIQISSMTNRSYAKSHLNRLKKKGYDAYIISTKSKDGRFVYKLRIGKHHTEAKAKKAADIFYKKEKMQYIIISSSADIDL